MTHRETVGRLFDYFFNKLHRSNYKLDFSAANQRKMVDNFAKLVGAHLNLPNVGVNNLIEYFAYQFFYWSKKNTKRRISLSWIIGPKAFQRWKDRKPGVGFYVLRFLKEHGLELDRLRQELAEDAELIDDKGLNQAEELEKTRFKGDARLFHCSETTTLYHHQSAICLWCECRITCKRLLKTHNPPLYKKRGYGATK